MAHKTTLTNQISPDPHVSFFIVQASSSHPPLAFFETQKIGNSGSFSMIFFVILHLKIVYMMGNVKKVRFDENLRD